jgi:hypothetical protein
LTRFSTAWHRFADEEHHRISMRYMDGKIGIAMTNNQLDTEFRKET